MQTAKTQDRVERNGNIHNLQAVKLAREAHEWRKVLMASGLPAGTIVAGFAVAEHFINRTSGYCFASHETIGQKCGMTRRGVQDAIRRLVAAGFLRVEKRGFQQTNRTYLALPQMHVGLHPDARGDVSQMHATTCTEPMTEPMRKDNLTASTEIVGSVERTEKPAKGSDGSREVAAPSSPVTDSPVRRSYSDETQEIIIGTAAVRVLGYRNCPKFADGRYLDRVIRDTIPAETMQKLVRKGRQGHLLLSDVADVVVRLGFAPAIQEAA